MYKSGRGNYVWGETLNASDGGICLIIQNVKLNFRFFLFSLYTPQVGLAKKDDTDANLYVSGLPAGTTDETMKEMFSQFGEVCN